MGQGPGPRGGGVARTTSEGGPDPSRDTGRGRGYEGERGRRIEKEPPRRFRSSPHPSSSFPRPTAAEIRIDSTRTTTRASPTTRQKREGHTNVNIRRSLWIAKEETKEKQIQTTCRTDPRSESTSAPPTAAWVSGSTIESRSLPTTRCVRNEPRHENARES